MRQYRARPSKRVGCYPYFSSRSIGSDRRSTSLDPAVHCVSTAVCVAGSGHVCVCVAGNGRVCVAANRCASELVRMRA
eukprot:829899-Rhodomonas_salina.2